MSTPADHQDWLRRDGFPVPPGGEILTDAERQLLGKFGHWMTALTSGTIAPVTPDQERFLRVHHGDEPPTTPFEVAWAKLRWMRSGELKPAVSPMELTNLFASLEAVRAEAMAAQQRYTFRRLDVLTKVQPELDAIEAEMTPELKALAERMAAAEAAVKAAVLEYGRTFHHGKVQATHYRGRVTFDNKGLQQYAEVNPEINRFKKVGQPYVAVKYVGATGEQLPAGGAAEALPPGESD
jgi:Protein of unknown function, DUF